jgi:uncharacterized protein involved in exopolysaccharide biosynthesis
MEKERKDFFDSTHLLVFLYEWRKPILLITAVGAVAAIIVSLIIPNKYKSTVILFPTTTSSVSKALLSEQRSQKDDILQFGEEEEAEQMLQVLNSNHIRQRVIDRFKLMQHYEIDSTSPYKLTNLYKQYESNISFERTEYMSVKIEVLDEVPEYAANIANYISDLYDSTMALIRKGRARMGMEYVEKLMALGVNDYESQAERLNEALGKAILEGKTAAAEQIRSQLKFLSQYGQAYMSLRDNLEFQRKQLSEVRAKYEQVKMDFEEKMPLKFVVDQAYPAEKKSYPVRWLIVTVTTLATFVIAVLAVIALESFNAIRKRKPFEKKA